MSLVEVNKLSRSYPRRVGFGSEIQTAVDRVSLTIEAWEAEALCAAPREAYTRPLVEATPDLPAVA